MVVLLRWFWRVCRLREGVVFPAVIASQGPLVGDELEDEREIWADPFALLLDERVCVQKIVSKAGV